MGDGLTIAVLTALVVVLIVLVVVVLLAMLWRRRRAVRAAHDSSTADPGKEATAEMVQNPNTARAVRALAAGGGPRPESPRTTVDLANRPGHGHPAPVENSESPTLRAAIGRLLTPAGPPARHPDRRDVPIDRYAAPSHAPAHLPDRNLPELMAPHPPRRLPAIRSERDPAPAQATKGPTHGGGSRLPAVRDSPVPQLFRFHAAGGTDQGPRERNDDTWLVRDHLLIVADGVGGKPSGKAAADLAARTLRDTVKVDAELLDHELVRAVELAHNIITEHGQRDPRKAEMACTLDAVVVHSGLLVGVHVGDSRAYHCPTGGPVEQVTEDEAVEGSLLQSLGGITGEVRPRTWQRVARSGDRVVLASDGLWSGLGDSMVLVLLAATARLDPDTAAQLLLDAALLAGATDNVTLVVADVTGRQTADVDQRFGEPAAVP